MPVTCVAKAGALLGEGPLWDAGRNLLWWVDIKRSHLHRFDPEAGLDTAIALDRQVTALGLADDGRLVASGEGGFGFVDPDEARFKPFIPVAGEAAGNRFNDGKVDLLGRFWAGTMDDAEVETRGALYRFDGTGKVERLASGIHVPNGPAFDSVGRMYFAHSPRRTIYRFEPGEAVTLDEDHVFRVFTPDQGYPDGMTCDAEDHLWQAFWQGGCLRRLSPEGEIVEELNLPVSRVTSCTFGGQDLSTLYITSASVGLSSEDMMDEPLAGGLFACRPKVGGLAGPRFRL